MGSHLSILIVCSLLLLIDSNTALPNSFFIPLYASFTIAPIVSFAGTIYSILTASILSAYMS
ncbi:MAG: hypothetical protein EOP34_06275 [Rickettsiales bacterium]|nr:MAG: hypothetical protein EOP34_06275 [Rickettsiales bacterium]